jgi:hypothetical protein
LPLRTMRLQVDESLANLHVKLNPCEQLFRLKGLRTKSSAPAVSAATRRSTSEAAERSTTGTSCVLGSLQLATSPLSLGIIMSDNIRLDGFDLAMARPSSPLEALITLPKGEKMRLIYDRVSRLSSTSSRMSVDLILCQGLGAVIGPVFLAELVCTSASHACPPFSAAVSARS